MQQNEIHKVLGGGLGSGLAALFRSSPGKLLAVVIVLLVIGGILAAVSEFWMIDELMSDRNNIRIALGVGFGIPAVMTVIITCFQLAT